MSIGLFEIGILFFGAIIIVGIILTIILFINPKGS